MFRGTSIFLFQEGSKEWRRYEAVVRRMVTPTKRSKTVSASPDIVKQWNSRGGPRNDLIRMMIQVQGSKAGFRFSVYKVIL